MAETTTDRRLREAYLELVGLTPRALDVLIAVMSHEVIFGRPAKSGDVLALVGGAELGLAELTRGNWLTAEGKSNGPKMLRARDRAWISLGVKRPAKGAA